MPENMTAAVLCLYERKHGISFPRGHKDLSGRWYPSWAEECQYCETLRAPSRAYPLSLYAHCKSAKHVADLFGVERKELLAELAKYELGRVFVSA